MPANSAAVVTGVGKPLEVLDTPYPEIGPDEIILESKAIAVNPADWKVPQMDFANHPLFKLQYPFIVGEDCAGIVAEVGSNVKSVVKGDRVIAQTNGVIPQNNARGGFQKYVVVPQPSFGKIPSSISFEQAVVIPLGMITAARGLFEKDQLDMVLPPSTEGKGKTLVVWGGSSSVGVNATQFAAAAGYEVISIASKHNFELCKSVGATHVFDYHDSDVIDQVAAALKGKDSVGAIDAIGAAETTKSLGKILLQADAKKRITSVLPGAHVLSFDEVQVSGFTSGSAEWSTTVAHLFNWLGEALEQGIIKTKPEPYILGTGLELAQKGLDEGIKGYSGKKLVITL